MIDRSRPGAFLCTAFAVAACRPSRDACVHRFGGGRQRGLFSVIEPHLPSASFFICCDFFFQLKRLCDVIQPVQQVVLAAGINFER